MISKKVSNLFLIFSMFFVLVFGGGCVSHNQLIRGKEKFECYLVEPTNKTLTTNQKLKVYEVNNDLLKQCLITYNSIYTGKYDTNLFLTRKVFVDKSYIEL